MKRHSGITKAAELAALSIVLAGINAFFLGDPGFLNDFFNPYLVIALFAAVMYGTYYGVLSLAFSVILVCIPLPTAVSFLTRGAPPDLPAFWASLWGRAPLPLAVTLVEIYLLGLVRNSLVRKERTGRAALAAVSRDKGLLKRQVRALQAVNIELEERISTQEDSITSLYVQVQALQSLNLEKAAEIILETVRRFVGATSCSIWRHNPEGNNLGLVASLGWEDTSPATLPDDNTIEGWVVRNNMMFSVKMLLENEALARLEKGRNVMCLPITAGRKIWGVLNIEQMPFAKYNLYAERLLPLLMAIANPALQRAIEFESVLRQEETNPVTGLPSIHQFYSALEKELGRVETDNGTLAVVILELLNHGTLAEQFGRESVLGLVAGVARNAREVAGGRADLFHYKADGQLVMLIPNMDSDGVSLFCLNVLEKTNATKWEVHGTRAYLELILGFATRSTAQKSGAELLEAAENLLAMQKV